MPLPLPLLLIGAGHVFRLADPIQSLILQERPDVVALELDAARYEGLLARSRGTFDAEAARQRAPRAYRFLAKYQEEVASSFGADVGGEMLAAAQAAQQVGSKLALIDLNAEQSLRRVWGQMPFRERGRLLWSAVVGILPFRRRQTVEQEIARYKADPSSYLAELGQQFPTVKRVLLDERNEHMARQLRGILESDLKVVAVVGDGHLDGLLALLRDLSPRSIRLSELQSGAAIGVRWRFGSGGRDVGFSFDQQSPEGTLGRD